MTCPVCGAEVLPQYELVGCCDESDVARDMGLQTND